MRAILLKIVEKILDCALQDNGVRGFVAWGALYLLGISLVEAVLWMAGLWQFRRDAAVLVVVFLGIHWALYHVAPVAEPGKWSRWFTFIVFAVGVATLAYRVITGDWSPMIPEYPAVSEIPLPAPLP